MCSVVIAGIIWNIIVFVSLSFADVIRISKTYPCSESPHLEVNATNASEEHWFEGKMKVAECHGSECGCYPPCSSVSPGNIHLTGCHNITHQMLIFEGETETYHQVTMLNYTGEVNFPKEVLNRTEETPDAILNPTDPPPPLESHRHYGLAAILLPMLVILGVLYRKYRKSTVQETLQRTV